MTPCFHIRSLKPWLVVVGLGVGTVWMGLAWSQEHEPASEPRQLASPGRVVIHQPSGPPTVATDLVDAQGQPVTLACSTCHNTRPPNRSTGAEDLDLFHQGLVFRHGPIGCLSCHDPTNYDCLKQPDGTQVPFTRVMDVCAQCHGPQSRDYRRGSHGGMVGHWDLSRGGRERKNCIDCHDPHAPAYQPVLPVFAPLSTSGGDH